MGQFKNLFLLCSLFLSYTSGTNASNIVNVEDSYTTYYLRGSNIDYFEDASGKLTIEDITSVKYIDSFQMPKKERPTNDRNTSNHWLRFTIKNTSSVNVGWVLEFYDFRIDEVKVYVPNDGKFKVLTAGDAYAFHDKKYKHKNFVFNFPLSDTETTYYVQARAFEKVSIFAVLRSHERFTSYAINEYFMLALFYGALLALSVFNLFLFITTGKKLYILYVLYTLSILLYAVTQDGIGFQYLWPEWPELNNYIFAIALYIFILFTILYVRAFLTLKNYFPLLDKVLRIFLIVRSVLLACGIIFIPELLTYKWLDILPLVLALISGLLVWKKGYKPARYFTLGFAFLFMGLMLNILSAFIINTNISFVYSFNFGVICQMMLLSLAIADRISEINRQKEAVEEKNKELDVFVYKASHDIKGPLKSIIGLTTIGMSDPKTQEGKTYFDMILKNTKRLDVILADLLMVTKVKQTEIQKVKINFEELIHEILASFQYYPSFHEMEFSVKVHGKKEFYSDAGLLYSICQNMIENGIKYKKPASPLFENQREKSFLHIDVYLEDKAKIIFKDNGVGISKEYQDRVFDMFFRGETDKAGSGLGLYLVKMSVEKLGGSISLESKEGVGSTFFVEFPN
ncbi:MAG: sensor histidine kinase [Cytophagaceae bacterium]|nr:sensor histidine kinase [Cytophagaceae bacterium]